jgi:hypothetical protein
VADTEGEGTEMGRRHGLIRVEMLEQIKIQGEN